MTSWTSFHSMFLIMNISILKVWVFNKTKHFLCLLLNVCYPKKLYCILYSADLERNSSLATVSKSLFPFKNFSEKDHRTSIKVNNSYSRILTWALLYSLAVIVSYMNFFLEQHYQIELFLKLIIAIKNLRWHWKTALLHLPFSWQVVYDSRRGV